MLRVHVAPDLGALRLAEVTPATIRDWYAGLSPGRPTARANTYALLKSIFGTAVEDELIGANPCRVRGASQKTRRHDVQVLTASGLDALAAAMPPPLALSVLLAAWCGLRWGELSELRRKDVAADASMLALRRAVTYRAGVYSVGPPQDGGGCS